ncbi:DUF3558 domain-containing protein [Streptomyces sp. NPDC046831]|uniref:DUF3558 domain-containing protein n=1 Tax=Streptomyces sp. NPDC046831 TaxID=3154805 RepID=UPI00340DC116
MLRKAYVPGTAALLAALLAGCTDGSSGDGAADDANPGAAGTATAAAQPGRYRTLPEPCGAVGHRTLDSLLPGIKQLTDLDQRDKAYEGEATLTYDNDRKVGCRWKVEATGATDHLFVDLERVVSYDNTVSDDTQAQRIFATKQVAADLPEPVSAGSGAGSASPSGARSGAPGGPAPTSSAPASPASPSASASTGLPSSELQPRTLSDLGDEAFVDDTLGSSGSTAKQRTVTVAFRTSNVIVTIVYEEQPTTVGVVPDSEEMQDKARKLAARLADSLGG